MRVEDCKYVSLTYRVCLASGDADGEEVENDSVGFIFGTGQIFPALEEKLRGLAPGAVTRVLLQAVDAFGEYDRALLREVPRKSFPPEERLEPGREFVAQSPMGDVTFHVRSVGDESVVVDFNHPLAGKPVHVEARVEEVRDLTSAEILAGGAICRVRKLSR